MAVSVSAFGLPRCYWMPIARYLSRDPESKPETCDGSEISDGRGSLNGLLNPDISSDEVTTILKEAGLTDYRFTATRNWIIDNPNDPRARVTAFYLPAQKEECAQTSNLLPLNTLPLTESPVDVLAKPTKSAHPDAQSH